MTFGLCAHEMDSVQNQSSVLTGDSVPLPKSLRSKTESNAQQNSNKRPLRSIVQLGGNFGISGSSGRLNISVQPQVGIYMTEWLLLGATFSYTFTYDWNFFKDLHSFGCNAYLQGSVFQKKLILHAGYEYLNYPAWARIDGFDQISRHEGHVVLLGAGYRGYISDKLSLYALALFPVYQKSTADTYYYGVWYIPIIRMGVSVDL